MGSRDEKDKTKVRKEKLAGYFFNLSQLTFTGTGVGGIAPILQGEFGVKNYVVIIFGIVMTFIFAGIANRILRYLVMEVYNGLLFFFVVGTIIGGSFLAWTYTKPGKKWLKEL